MFLALAIVLSLASLACDIFVIIKIFQSGNVGLGILAIFCPLFTFIYGWIKVNEFGIKNVMIAWSVLIALSVVNNVALAPTSTTVTTVTPAR